MNTTNFLIFARTAFGCALFIAQSANPLSGAFAGQLQSNKPELRNFTFEFLQKNGEITSSVFNDDRGVIVFRVLVNGREVWALLDTGTGATLIDTRLARELGLETVRMGTPARTRTGTLERSKIVGVELLVPGQFRFPADFNGVDLSGASKALDKEIGVVIGRDILNAVSFYVDTAAKRIVFLPSKAMKFQEGQITRLTLKDGLLQGTINGIAANMEIDLGANGQLDIPQTKWDRYIQGDLELGINRKVDATGEARTDIYASNVELRLGSIIVQTRTSRVPELRDGIDAYVGYGFFNGRKVMFDYAASEVLVLRQ